MCGESVTQSPSCNVLISSAGRRVALLRLWREALRRAGVEARILAADMSPCSSAYHDADHHFEVPRCTDERFVPALIEICRSHDVRVLVPTIDTELPMLAAARGQFEDVGTLVNISSPETIAIAYDKHSTHEWLVSSHLPSVAQARVDDVLAKKQDFPFPAIVKPARGSSSIGVARVHGIDELAPLAGRDFVIQEIAPGVEYTVDVYVNRESECVCTVPRRRIEVRAGEVSKGITVHLPVVERVATDAAERLPGAYGVLNVQIFHDAETDRCSIIEVNPRFGGGFPLTWQAGAAMPLWLIEDALGRESSYDLRWRDGLVMLRFDDAVFISREEAGL